MSRRARWAVVLCSLALLVTVGCASPPLDINKRLTSLNMIRKKPPDATYVVDPPDVLKVQFLNQPELETTQQVRQDGVITLPHVGEVMVAGLTPKEIRENLEETYLTYFKEPKVVVTVTEYRSKRVFIYGEVMQEGLQPYTGSQTVADLVGQAGGVTQFAATSSVQVIRGDPDAPEIYDVDLDELIYEGKTRQNVSLAENDVVYVPPTFLASVGYTIQQLTFPITSMFSLARPVRWAARGGYSY